MSTERVRRNTAATLSVTFYGDETPIDADDAVTVEIRKADGTELYAGTANRTETGVYTYTLPPQSQLNNLNVDWSGSFGSNPATVTTYVEIVGAEYFSIAEFRAYDTVLSNTTKYTTQKLIDARSAVEAEFEGICRRAFVPRYHREVIEGDGTGYIWLSKPEPLHVISLTVDGDNWADVTPRRHAYNLRQLYFPNNSIPSGSEVVIEYEYGMWTVPERIKHAALKRAKYRLVAGSSRIDERATVMNVPDFGNFVLATPGQRGSYTGIPDVDVVLDDYVLHGA